MYADLVFDHFEHPRHQGFLDTPTHVGVYTDPDTRDNIWLQLDMPGPYVLDAKWSGSGSALATAGASMLIDYLIGKRPSVTEDEFLSLFGPGVDPSCLAAWHALQTALEYQ